MLRALTFCLFCLTLISCGDNAQTGTGTGADQAYQHRSDLCSSEFVSDYNSVMISARGIFRKKSDLVNVRSLATDFKRKYAGVNCKAEIKRDGQLDGSPQMVNADQEMNDLLKQIDAAEAQLSE